MLSRMALARAADSGRQAMLRRVPPSERERLVRLLAGTSRRIHRSARLVRPAPLSRGRVVHPASATLQ